MDKNPPASARDMHLIPGLGRLQMPRSNWAHVPQLLSPRSRAREPQLLNPVCLEPVLQNKRGRSNEKPPHCKKSNPHSTQLEKDPVWPKTKKEKAWVASIDFLISLFWGQDQGIRFFQISPADPKVHWSLRTTAWETFSGNKEYKDCRDIFHSIRWFESGTDFSPRVPG